MKKQTFIYIYYALLIVVLASRINAASDPPMLMRLAFIGAVIAPVLAIKEVCYPAIITLFYVISLNGFAYSYMPYNLWLYVTITLLILFFYWKRVSLQIKINTPIPKIILAIPFYIFLIDLIHVGGPNSSGFIHDNLFCFILLSFFLLLIEGNEENALSQVPLCFSIITVVLCLAFLTNREQYILQSFGDIDRTGWTDPNYFGTVIGMGSICGLIKLFDKDDRRKLRLVEKFIYYLAIIISVPVLLLNASRGAVLAVVSGFLILFVFSKASFYYKVIVVSIGAVALLYLYSNAYFDLLLLRVENDDGYGSERTLIWASKLNAYSNGSFLELIFGYGTDGGLLMGWNGKAKGFHNDFVGYLVDYGIVGLTMFLYMLYYPIKKTPSNSSKKPAVIVLIVYIVTCIMTLEPFVMGVLAYFVLYMYALLLAQNENNRYKRRVLYRL